MLPCALRPLVLGVCATLFFVEFVGLILAAACFSVCLAPKYASRESRLTAN